VGATLKINVQVCAIVQGTVARGGYTYYYDASMPKNVIDSGFGYYYNSFSDSNPGAVATSDADARAKTDCGALGTKKPTYFQVGLSAEAFFEGQAAFNFAVMSDGITAKPPLAFPSTCNTPSFNCVPTQIPGLNPVVIPTITVTVAGLPITIDPTITLKAAAVGSLDMPDFRLQFGASASVNVKLGGKVSFKELPSSGLPTIQVVPYNTFTTSFSTLPFILSGFKAAAGSIDATIVPEVQVKIWKILPFTIMPIYNMVHKLELGGSRQLGLRGGEEQEAGHAQRSLAACSSGQVSSSATAQGALGVRLDSITAFEMVESVTGVDLKTAVWGLVAGYDQQLIDTTVIVDPKTASFSVDGAVPAAATACVAVGSSIGTGGAISAGGGGGGSGSGGSSASGTGASSSGGSSGLTGGALIGVIVGCSVLVLLIIGAVCYFVFVRKGKASAGGGVVSSKNPAAAAASEGGGSRKAKSPRAGAGV
jgi:hypothetical protein